jgi:hypothetical protein
MILYKNLGRNSSVAAYESGADYIVVRFRDGGTYLYTYESTGAYDVDKMKSLANSGQGLNSYIGRIVRKRYSKKLA